MSTPKFTKTISLGYKLKLTQHALRLEMDKALKTVGLTTPQYAVLSQLELHPGISNAALARASFITAQTMHGIVANLEKRNLIERQQDPNHGRILTTKLRKEGLHILIQAHKIVRETDKKMIKTFSKQEETTLNNLLEVCITNLEANSTPPPSI